MSVRPHHHDSPSGPDSPSAAPAASAATVTAPVAPAVPASPTVPADSAGDVVRWAAFSCLLVPVVLVVFGTSVGGAAVPALGLVAVTAVCRLLLRRSERSVRVRRTAGNTKSQGARQGARAHD
ncbi:hypothetical protein [Streptomyces sp. IB2014 016-6]|uniref:hypothetical protein n=1 Tax=Streptomyces sp. IB2014 016-6 TaxID=2517818 RepID=UPI0011CA9F8F|nr:hypothetical protein [Streptomyces sp. IB2014 016-6]TXL89113.1 hypothetical protein EW053_16555 [Streptomyces sp. IB2014 016-6]